MYDVICLHLFTSQSLKVKAEVLIFSLDALMSLCVKDIDCYCSFFLS